VELDSVDPALFSAPEVALTPLQHAQAREAHGDLSN
jgi:hypothetical protein